MVKEHVRSVLEWKSPPLRCYGWEATGRTTAAGWRREFVGSAADAYREGVQAVAPPGLARRFTLARPASRDCAICVGCGASFTQRRPRGALTAGASAAERWLDGSTSRIGLCLCEKPSFDPQTNLSARFALI